MKTTGQNNRRATQLTGWIGVLFIIGAVGVQAQVGGFTTPLHVYASQGMLDEQGRKLEGSSQTPGDAVHILWASNNVMYPPAADGTPDPRNPHVDGGITAVGHMMPSHKSVSGKFNLSLLGGRRLPAGAKIFARVFNAASQTSATFYADSPVFTVSGNKAFDVQVKRTDQPLYRDDKDGDGLVESWEISLGTSDENADSDGDSMSDGDEFAAGTDAADKNSLLAISGIASDDLVSKGGSGVNQVTLAWPSVTGKRYRVQFTAASLADHPQFSDVGSVITATSDFTTIAVDVDEQKESGMYRIRLAE